MAENELVLNQRNALGFDLQIKLVNGRELQILNKGKKINQSYSIDILSLQDKSKKRLTISWKWLMSSIGFFLMMLLLLKVMPDYLNSNKNIYLGMILFAGTIGSIMCFIQFWKHTSSKQIFLFSKCTCSNHHTQ